MSASSDKDTWIERLSVYGTALLEPFTAESTRSEGKQVILVSVVTLLLSVDVLSITDGEAGGLTLKPGEGFDGVVLMGLVCLYFLIIFVLDLIRDWKASFYKRLPAFEEQQRLLADIQKAQQERQHAHERRSKEIDRLLEIRKQKLAEIDQVKSPAPSLDASIDELEDNIEASSIARKKRQEMHEAFDDYVRTDGLDDLLNEHLRSAFDQTQTHRSEVILSTLKTTNLLDRWRIAVDVMLPCGLCAIAIFVCAWRLWS